MLPLKIDLHVHTCYSHDCTTSLKEVVLYAKRNGLDGVAITDHNTVEGALKLVKRKPRGLIVIPGIEVSTQQGHLLGLNVKTLIPPNFSIKKTIELIHEDGGIAVIPHPFAFIKEGIRPNKNFKSYGLDAIEVANSSNFPFFIMSYLASRFAENMNLPKTGGSDSHIPDTIGLAYTIIENAKADPETDDIIQAIKEGMIVPVGKAIPWMLRLKKMFKKR